MCLNAYVVYKEKVCIEYSYITVMCFLLNIMVKRKEDVLFAQAILYLF